MPNREQQFENPLTPVVGRAGETKAKEPIAVKQEKLQEEEITKEDILEQLHLYHQTTKEKWEKIKKAGAVLSESQLSERGLITKEQISGEEDILDDATNTGVVDREAGRDKYVFLSHLPAGYGEVTLELDLSALGIKDAKVATAGDWLRYVNNKKEEKFYRNSVIPASDFVSYLEGFLKKLPNPKWFWGERDKDSDSFAGEAFKEKFIDKKPEKSHLFYGLTPEIMIPDELPLEYIRKVTIENEDGTRVEEELKNQVGKSPDRDTLQGRP